MLDDTVRCSSITLSTQATLRKCLRCTISQWQTAVQRYCPLAHTVRQILAAGTEQYPFQLLKKLQLARVVGRQVSTVVILLHMRHCRYSLLLRQSDLPDAQTLPVHSDISAVKCERDCTQQQWNGMIIESAQFLLIDLHCLYGR